MPDPTSAVSAPAARSRDVDALRACSGGSERGKNVVVGPGVFPGGKQHSPGDSGERLGADDPVGRSRPGDLFSWISPMTVRMVGRASCTSANAPVR
jgi:hypothetical protein